MDKIETAAADVKADVKKGETELETIEKDATATKTWLATNWQYAVAFTIGGLFLGLSIGIKIGTHLHG